MKRQAKYWEKIFVKDISDKELASKMYRETQKSTIRKRSD